MDWVHIHTAQGPGDVYLVRDLLVEAGVKVQIRGEQLAGLGGVIPIDDSHPTIWVPDDQVSTARAVVSRFRIRARSGEAWDCSCGESNDPSFGSCWKCGQDSPVVASMA